MSDLFVGKLRAVRPLAVLGTIGVLVAACGGTSTAGTGLAADQTLRFPSDSAIGTLDPAQINAETDVEIYQNLFDGLLKFDDKLNVVPDIATKLPDISSDGLTYTFKLNPNAKFWNGHAVKASDFIYSFSRSAAEGQDAYGGNFDHVPDWWGSPQPTVQHVKMDFIGDMAQGVSKFEQGGYDLVGYGGMGSDISPDDILRIQKDPTLSKQLKFVNKVRTIWVQYGFGRADSVFKGDLASGPAHDLRMAFSLAIDRAQLVQVACAGGITCSAADGGLITKGLKGYAGDGSDPLAKFDATQAKTLLKSGDPTGTKTKNLTYYYDPNKAIYKATAENIQSQWQTNLGIHVNIQPIDHATFIKNYTHHQYNLFREGWQADYDHPQDWFDNLFIKGGGSNGGEFTDPMVESLVKKADAEPDINKAIPDYISANKQMMAHAAYAPPVYFKGEFLFKPYLPGAGP